MRSPEFNGPRDDPKPVMTRNRQTLSDAKKRQDYDLGGPGEQEISRREAWDISALHYDMCILILSYDTYSRFLRYLRITYVMIVRFLWYMYINT